MVLVPIVQKRGHASIRLKDDIAATTSIAARRTAPWDVLLPSERDQAVSAIAGLHRNANFVYKHSSLTNPHRYQCGTMGRPYHHYPNTASPRPPKAKGSIIVRQSSLERS
jgi:hypothetical protein